LALSGAGQESVPHASAAARVRLPSTSAPARVALFAHFEQNPTYGLVAHFEHCGYLGHGRTSMHSAAKINIEHSQTITSSKSVTFHFPPVRRINPPATANHRPAYNSHRRSDKASQACSSSALGLFA